MKRLLQYITVGLFVAVSIVALSCASPTTSSPALTPLPIQQSPSTTTAPKSSLLSQEDSSWTKVVEKAKSENKITIYSFAFVGDVAIAVQEAFRSKYGLSVDIVSGSGPNLQERLKTESRSRNMVADVVEGNVTNAVNMKADGLTRPYGTLPVLSEDEFWTINPRIDLDGHILYYSPQFNPLWINTKLVKQSDEPHSWSELTQAKWKDKIIANDPALLQLMDQFYVVMLKRGLLSQDYFIALGKQGIKRTYPAQNGQIALARGEGQVALLLSDSTTAIFVQQGAPIRPIDMDEGVPAQSLAFSLVRESPHPNTATLFANWLLSRDGQEVYAKARAVLPIRKDVTDYRPEGIKLQYKKPVVYTIQELEEGAKAFLERRLNGLWASPAK